MNPWRFCSGGKLRVWVSAVFDTNETMWIWNMESCLSLIHSLLDGGSLFAPKDSRVLAIH